MCLEPGFRMSQKDFQTLSILQTLSYSSMLAQTILLGMTPSRSELNTRHLGRRVRELGAQVVFTSVLPMEGKGLGRDIVSKIL